MRYQLGSGLVHFGNRATSPGFVSFAADFYPDICQLCSLKRKQNHRASQVSLRKSVLSCLCRIIVLICPFLRLLLPSVLHACIHVRSGLGHNAWGMESSLIQYLFKADDRTFVSNWTGTPFQIHRICFLISKHPSRFLYVVELCNATFCASSLLLHTSSYEFCRCLSTMINFFCVCTFTSFLSMRVGWSFSCVFPSLLATQAFVYLY